MHELVIVGAGPAGVAAALWARAQGLTLEIVERAPEPGGQLHHVYFHPHDLPGVPEGTGPAIAAVFAKQLETAGVPVTLGHAVSLETIPGGAAVVLAEGGRLEARAVLVATGARRRRLGVPGERELEGHGVSYSATRDRQSFAGGPVVVVGGGDAAFENALLLAEVGCRVVLVMREAPRARAEFQARVAAEPRIERMHDAVVESFVGNGKLEAVRIARARAIVERRVVGAVIKVGMTPNTEWCRSLLLHDTDGYLACDVHGRTSCQRVWAAGDVTRPELPAIVVAMGAAALAVADVRATLRNG